MSDPIWRKPDSVVDARIMRFLAGEDVKLDRELLRHDIRASRAHAQALQLAGILDGVETGRHRARARGAGRRVRERHVRAR
jgi:argininosuccinate lyase